MNECALGICDGSHWLVDEETNTATPCPCRAQQIARNKARGIRAVVPRRYEDVGFDRYPVNEIAPSVVVTTRRFVSQIDAMLDAGNGIWFLGNVGTGKTALAMLISKAAIEAGRTVARFPCPDLLRRIRTEIYTEGNVENLRESLAAVDLLHIDDIGAERTTDWVIEELYAIVNARYEEKKSMVITTNIMEIPDLERQIGKRTVSRLIEMCDQLPVLGTDRRQEIRMA